MYSFLKTSNSVRIIPPNCALYLEK